MTEKTTLADLFSLIAEEKKKQEKIIKSPNDLHIDVNDAVNSIFEELSGKKPEPKEIVEETIEIVEPQIEQEEDYSSSLIEASLGLFAGDASTKTDDPLTPLDKNYVTHQDLSDHYKTFIQRVQQQLSTVGGGGETKFRFLDDVKRGSMTPNNDNWVLEYDSKSESVKFTNQIGPIDYIRFDTSHTHEEERVPGTICWSQEDETLNLTHPNGVVQQVGQETYGYVRNRTGATIRNGSAVRFSGAEQNGTARLLVAPFQANNEFPTLYGFGIATEDIADSADGKITVWGKVRDVNTSAFNVGDILYVSPDSAGGLTNVRPTAPNNVIPMAAVLSVDSAQGEIFVRPSYEQQKNYGSFASDSNQSILLANTAQTIRINKTNFSQQLSIDSDYNIVANEPGLYSFTCNFQVLSTDASAKQVYTWIQFNDSDVPRSSRRITLTGNSVSTGITSFHNVSMAVGDKVKHRWASTATAVRLDATAATAFSPSAPSVVIEVDQTAL